MICSVAESVSQPLYELVCAVWVSLARDVPLSASQHANIQTLRCLA